MKALMFVAPGQLCFDEVDAPTLLDPGDALVRPLAASTCDLDHQVIAGRTPFSVAGPFPLGHECVATVVETGPGCGSVAPGDIVGVAWHIACGTCEQCGLGHPARCLRHGDAQYGLPVNGQWGGTFSELLRVPYADANLVRLPAGVDPVHLVSIGDNLSLAWESVVPALAGIDEPRVAVFGGTGSIGLFCVDVAVGRVGARTVYYDDDPARMAVAEKLGAVVADPAGRRERDFHLAVDASADPDRLRMALRSVMPEGQVNSVGIYFEDLALPMLAMYMRGVRFHLGKGHARPNMTPALEAVAAGLLRPELVISGVHGWEEIPDVLTSAGAGHKPVFLLER